MGAASEVEAFAAVEDSAAGAFVVVALAPVDFAQLESAAGDGLSAVSAAPVGERLEVVGAQSLVALAGALQDGVRDGADDGRDIDPAGVIAGLGTVRRQVSASQALRTTAATIHMTTDTMTTAPMAMMIALRCHKAFGMVSRIVWCG